MNLIGLTGNIGSGKSFVAGIFKTLGIPVYDSDMRAKHLMNTDKALREKITGLLGTEAYSSNFELNRSWIADQVFNHPEQLDQLNAIVHPAVYEDLLHWTTLPEQKSAPYLIQESAILFEENLTERFKGILLVIAPEETRISRIMERDHVSKEQVRQRNQHQWPDEIKIPLSDFVIFNDGDRQLIAQVMDIDQMIRSSLDNNPQKLSVG